MSSSILNLTQQLIRCPSVSPNDAGCQDILIARLSVLGFTIEPMQFNETMNFWAQRGGGEKGRTLTFVGHTDVVPAGDITQWETHPFEPILYNGRIYGRGAADMKGSLAAMIVATERFIKDHPDHLGRLTFLITADEELHAKNGTRKVVEKLMERKEKIDYCLVGEPSSNLKVGDIIKNGRRGSLTADLVIQGVQGHVAYPNFAENPIHRSLNALMELVATNWDHGNDFFPPTTIQIINIHTVNNSENMIPSELTLKLNFRFSTELTETIIRKRVDELMQRHELRYRINWHLYGNPFITPSGELLDAVVETVKYYQHIMPHLERTGGTSDGRFVALMGAQVVELGPINTTIHKVNECVSVADLELLSYMYQRIIEHLILK